MKSVDGLLVVSGFSFSVCVVLLGLFSGSLSLVAVGGCVAFLAALHWVVMK